jgi:hypothetical protein
MQQHTDDRAPLWIQINDQFWPQNRNYIIGELVLVSLLALGSFYLLLKTFVRSSRRAEFKHARLLLMIAAPILTV